MDTRFWGPSGWKLLHLIAYDYPSEPTFEDKQVYGIFYNNLKYVLPCKYCRQSLTGYIEELPIEGYLDSKRKLTKWIYEIHNKVNNKLRLQKLLHDPDPPLKEVDKIYIKMLDQKCLLPGWDFLYSIAFNYPKTKETISYDKMQHYIIFFKLLGQVIPCKTYRKLYCKYTEKYKMEKYLDSGRNLTKWLHKVNCSINKELSHEEDNKSYRRVCFVVESHRAKSCSKKSHKGKTCRKKTKVKQKDYIS